MEKTKGRANLNPLQPGSQSRQNGHGHGHGHHSKGSHSPTRGTSTSHRIGHSSPNPTLVKHFRGHRDTILGLDFHPNLPQLVSCGADQHITIWNYKQETRALRYEGHKGHVNDVEFSKNGDLMVTGGEDETIRIWVPTVKGEVRSFKGHSSQVRSVNFNPSNPSIIASGSNDKTIKLWSLDHKSDHKSSSSSNRLGSFIKSFYNIHTNWIRSVRFSPDGRLLVSASEDKSICLMDLRSYECVAKIQSHLGTPQKTEFNPCASHYIGTSTSDHCFTIHDLRKAGKGGGDLVQVYQKLQKGSINSFAYHPSGDYAVTVADDATIKILDLVEGRPIYTLHGPREALYAVSFSKNGDLLATAGKDRELLIWEPFLIPYEGGEDEGGKEKENSRATNLVSTDSNSGNSSPVGTLSNLSRSSSPASYSHAKQLSKINSVSSTPSGEKGDETSEES